MNPTANHSPGPWSLYSPHLSEQYVDRLYKVGGDGEHYQSIFRIHHDHDITQPEAEANARLISAAPDMPAALEQAVVALNTAPRFKAPLLGVIDSDAVAAICEAAIAKAKGGAQ